MLIKSEHYNHMKLMISLLPAKIINEAKAYLATINVNDRTKIKDKDTFFRWHLSHKAQLTKYICDNIYTYADDSHIDTALKKIIKELNLA